MAFQLHAFLFNPYVKKVQRVVFISNLENGLHYLHETLRYIHIFPANQKDTSCLEGPTSHLNTRILQFEDWWLATYEKGKGHLTF